MSLSFIERGETIVGYHWGTRIYDQDADLLPIVIEERPPEMIVWRRDWDEPRVMPNTLFGYLSTDGKVLWYRSDKGWHIEQFRPTSDFNRDGRVDMTDFGILQRNLGRPIRKYDLNGDGRVDGLDVDAFIRAHPCNPWLN